MQKCCYNCTLGNLSNIPKKPFLFFSYLKPEIGPIYRKTQQKTELTKMDRINYYS